VAARRDARRVDLLDRGQAIDGGRDIRERPRPAAAFVPDAPELDVPRNDPAPHRVVRERVHQRPVPPAAPEAAVDEHDTRLRTAFPRR
jgi:hypothetical protein